MIEWLTQLPKVIDAFITGVIEFCYQFLGSVLRVCRSPLNGARTLEANEDQLSSRTMLFGAVAIFNLSAYIDVSNTLALSGNRLGHFAVMVIVVYVFFDALAALGALYCSKRQNSDPKDDVRRFLRYGFAASLVVLAVATFILRLGHSRNQIELVSMIEFAIMVAAGFYPPAVIFCGLAGWGKGRVTRSLILFVMTPIVGLAIEALLQGFGKSYAQIQDGVGGAIYASPGLCTASPTDVRVVIAIDNASATVAYLNHRTLRLNVDYGFAREELPFVSLDEDVVIVASRAQAVLVAHAQPESAAFHRFLSTRGTAICQVLKGTTGRTLVTEHSAPLEIAPSSSPTPAAAD